MLNHKYFLVTFVDKMRIWVKEGKIVKKVQKN